MAGFAPFFITTDRTKNVIIASLGALAVFMFAIYFDPVHQFRDRIDMLGATLELGRSKLFGYGIGTFQDIRPEYGLSLFGQHWRQAHNDLVQVFFESGYLPFTVGTVFILAHCKKLFFYRQRNNVIRNIAHGTMSAFILFALLGFPFHFAPSAVAFAVVWSAYRGIA